MTRVQRFTTEYVDREDRVRLIQEVSDGSVQVTWLTRRLLDRLVAHLVGWLERSVPPTPRREALQAFVQEAAAAKLTVQPAVQAGPAVQGWLVDSVDVSVTAPMVGLVLKAEGGTPRLEVTMDGEQLRQWLTILRTQYLKADWSLAAWPPWMQEGADPVAQQRNVLH